MKKISMILASLCSISACVPVQSANNSSPAPKQVVYRFDDHRYLELTGFNCQGLLRYVDTKKNINSDINDGYTGYRVYTKTYIHPSERYIVIPEYEDTTTFSISKDFGQTWEFARYSPGAGADPYGKRIPARKTASGMEVVAGENTSPLYEDIVSFTVVADQGFVLTKWGDIYLSSKPFDEPDTHGGKWGKDYLSLSAIQEYRSTFADRKNFQNLPTKVPHVKNYTGWDKMRCNPDLGLPAAEQGK